MPARIPTCRVGRCTDNEHGVSLVEVIVVVLIIAILGASLLAGRNSSNRAGSVSAARAVAANYHDSIEAFMRDHGGRVPEWNIAQDWPSSPPAGSGVTGGTGGQWGPVNFGARGKPYLDRIPEAVAGGRVVLVNNGTATTSPGVRSRVMYERISDRRYRLHVQRATSTGWATTCSFGTEGGSRC